MEVLAACGWKVHICFQRCLTRVASCVCRWSAVSLRKFVGTHWFFLGTRFPTCSASSAFSTVSRKLASLKIPLRIVKSTRNAVFGADAANQLFSVFVLFFQHHNVNVALFVYQTFKHHFVFLFNSFVFVFAHVEIQRLHLSLNRGEADIFVTLRPMAWKKDSRVFRIVSFVVDNASNFLKQSSIFFLDFILFFWKVSYGNLPKSVWMNLALRVNS